jgi:hypothetical protein
MLGTPKDWVSISTAGSAAGQYLRWQYTSGASTGSSTFPLAGLPSGDYVARVYFNDSSTISGESATFHVGAPLAIDTNRSSYAPGESVIASYTGAPGNPYDWIAIAPAGSALTQYTSWAYIFGVTDGSKAFPGLPNGQYVARLFLDNGFTQLKESASFTITAATVAAQTPTFTTGQTIPIVYSGFPGNATDWISIAAPGAAASDYVAWAYVSGTSGTHVFPTLSPGQYVARAHFNNELAIRATSSVFRVDPVWNGTNCNTGLACTGEYGECRWRWNACSSITGVETWRICYCGGAGTAWQCGSLYHLPCGS